MKKKNKSDINTKRHILITILIIIFIILIIDYVIKEREPLLALEYNYDYHEIIKVSERPLFAANGRVNQDVLDALMEILDSDILTPKPKTEWESGMEFTDTSYSRITAREFSKYVIGEPENMSHSGAIAIRLFESIPNRYGLEHYHLSEFTNQWWQLVYRATDFGEDVLTLWMMEPYRITHYNGNRYENITGMPNEIYFERPTGENGGWQRIEHNFDNTIPSDDCLLSSNTSNNFFLEANYSQSIVRSNLLRDLSGLLNKFNIENYLVAPRDLPGNWQSSRYQTGSNTAKRFYVSGQFYSVPQGDEFYTWHERFPGSDNPNDGLGAAGLIWGRRHLHFNLANGNDGLSVGPFENHWPNTNIRPTYTDLLWLPSDFEIRSMGHNKDPATFQTFIETPGDPTSGLRWNWRNTKETDWRTDLTGGRSGLWQLNGFNRGHNPANLGEYIIWETKLSWLRSSDGLAMGSANTVCHNGNRYSYGVIQRAGIRPGIHLSLTELLNK